MFWSLLQDNTGKSRAAGVCVYVSVREILGEYVLLLVFRMSGERVVCWVFHILLVKVSK